MIETRAILLVDVVDSTRLGETLGDARLADLWRAHDRVARDLLPLWRGLEIDKTDGFLLLFANVEDALGYAVAYHRALESLEVPLKARAGLHFGQVMLRQNSERDIGFGAKPIELEGLAKPVAARVMSLARGGQTLLTPEARHALGNTAFRVQSYGHWHLKGVAAPIELYEAGPADATFLPPTDNQKAYRVARRGALWIPVRRIDNNLPLHLGRFIGRVRELATLLQRMSQTRMLTLFGAGGIGKTRLGLQVVTASMGDFPDGAWIVELAPLSEPNLVAQTVAATLGLKEQATTPIMQTLIEHLQDKSILLFLDNCEHLIDACAHVADEILQRCSGVSVLASSREALRIAGEQTYRVPSLSLPGSKEEMTPTAVVTSEAVQLFIDRAVLAEADFEVTSQNASTLASICRRLDGIPLAIELAAALVSSLPVEEIDGNLNRRLELLTGGARTALPRQQTLRAMIDWSYELLNESERLALRRLSVFAGGWTLPAAERVCADDIVDGRDVRLLLTSLCEKSLAIADPHHDDQMRYHLLETIRQYSRELLQRSQDVHAVCVRHGDHYLGLAREFRVKQYGADQGEWLERLEREHENLRAALTWSVAEPTSELGLHLCGSLQRFWWMRGHLSEGRSWCERMLERCRSASTTSAFADVLNAAGTLAFCQGDYDAARVRYEEALPIYRALNVGTGITSTLNNLGNVYYELADYASARALREESLDLARKIGGRVDTAIALNNLGNVLAQQGDYRAAEALLWESLEIDRELQDRSGIAITLGNMGDFASEQANYREARRLYEESLAIKRELGDRGSIAVTLIGLSNVFVDQGELGAARDLGLESLSIRREIGDRGGIADSLDGLAAVIAADGNPLRAACVWGAADRLREQIRAPLSPNERPRYQRRTDAARSAAGDSVAFERMFHEGRRLTLEQAMELALKPASQARRCP